MKAVSVINFKGGVGKTTLSYHLAAFLAREKKVLLIDVDHQSSLSIVVLGPTLWDKCVKSQRTINRVFESFCNRKIPMPTTDIVIPNAIGERDKTSNTFYPNLDFVSAQFELDDTEIDLASTNYGNANLSDWEKRTLLAGWLDSIKAQANYDYVVFDCPPATKIVSQNALAASHGYIIPVIPDDLFSRGVTHFRNLVQTKIDGKLDYLKTSARVSPTETPKAFVANTQLVGIVAFLVKHAGRAKSGYTNIHTEQIEALKRQWKSELIATIGLNKIGVPEAVNAGWPVWNWQAQNVTHAVEKMMTDICSELKARIDNL